MELPKKSIDTIVSVTDQNEKIINRLDALEKLQKDKSLPERYPFTFMIISAACGASISELIQWVVQLLRQ